MSLKSFEVVLFFFTLKLPDGCDSEIEATSERDRTLHPFGRNRPLTVIARRLMYG